MQDKTGAGREGLKKLDGRLFWAVFSLFAALLIWVYYTANYGEAETRTFYGVEVTYIGEAALQDSMNLYISQEDTTTVNVTLSGNRQDILRLSRDDIKAVVNLSNVTRAGYRTMAYTLSYPSNVNQTNIQTVSLSPQTIGLQISRRGTKTVPITGVFVGNTMDGYVVDTSEMTFDPAGVTFVGPEEDLDQIAKVQVTVDRDEVSSSFTAAANYILLDADGEILSLDNVLADVDTVSVAVPVNMVKEVALDVTIINGGGATGDNVKKTIEPSVITVAGDASVLDGLNTISLATVDLSDYISFPTTDYNIVLPNDVECLSKETTAAVSLEITGLETKLLTVTNLSYSGLAEGYTASIMDTSSIVTVRGPEDILNQVSANNIRVVADLTDVTTTSRVPANVYVDGFDEVGAVGTYRMYVRVEETEE